MSTQTPQQTQAADRAPVSVVPGPRTPHVRRPARRRHGFAALVFGVVVAASATGVVVGTRDVAPTPTRTVSVEPNANVREGRVPAPAVQEPNTVVGPRLNGHPTTRQRTVDSQVPASAVQEPNANAREGRTGAAAQADTHVTTSR